MKLTLPRCIPMLLLLVCGRCTELWEFAGRVGFHSIVLWPFFFGGGFFLFCSCLPRQPVFFSHQCYPVDGGGGGEGVGGCDDS